MEPLTRIPVITEPLTRLSNQVIRVVTAEAKRCVKRKGKRRVTRLLWGTLNPGRAKVSDVTIKREYKVLVKASRNRASFSTIISFLFAYYLLFYFAFVSRSFLKIFSLNVNVLY